MLFVKVHPAVTVSAFAFSCVLAAQHLATATTWQDPPSGGDAEAASENSAPIPDPTLPTDWVDKLSWRSIGPANMSGRITDFAVYEADPSIWWAATASGGLLKTVNNGITFEHQFDREATVSVGCVAVAPSDSEIVWVGTGESNPRNSVSWGDGVYKSVDGGKSWKNMGLKESFQIGAMVIHPTNPDIVYVGALGRLYGQNEQRGLYKTTDGGENWERILYIDDKTGIGDLKMKPGYPETLLVATYERQRDGFDTNDPAKKWGPSGALYKTTDGGQSFKKITKGLPTSYIGRIGLDYYRANPDVVFAIVESQAIGMEPENAAYAGLTGQNAEVGARLTEISAESPAEKAGLQVGDIIIAVDDEAVHSYDDLLVEIRSRLAGDTVAIELSRDRESVFAELTFALRPKPEDEQDDEDAEVAAESSEAESGTTTDGEEASDDDEESERDKTIEETETVFDESRPRPFSTRLGGQRENLQNQQGPDGHEFGGLYKSVDGGESWTRINSVNPRPMYFSRVRVDPSDENYIYVLGVSLYRTKDGGETFTSDGGRGGVHVDHHAMWVDPANGKHILLGNDGGIYVTYDRMENWDHHNHVAIGQFYHVAVGPRRNYRVYGGLQDNGSWGGPSRSRAGSGPVNEDWISIGGGDGFICRIDADDPDQIYFESQNGSMGRYNFRTGERGFIRPRGPRGERYRFNWKTPFILSNHNSRIYYTAGNYVFRSLDKGDSLKTISPEITNTDRGSATALAESPRDSDVLYVGTDDGALWMTRDGGNQWFNLFDLPQEEEDEKGKAEDDEQQEAAQEAAEADPQSQRPATTQRPSEGGRGGFGQRRGGGSGGGGSGNRFAQMLERFDANDDGKLQMSELPEQMAGFMSRLDADDDGVITSEEMSGARFGQRGRGGARGGGGAGDRPAGGRQRDRQQQPRPRQEAEARRDDPISGRWVGDILSDRMPETQIAFDLKLDDEGRITGTITGPNSTGEVSNGRFDRENGTVTFSYDFRETSVIYTGKVEGSTMTGTAEVGGGMFSFNFEVARAMPAPTQSIAQASTDGPQSIDKLSPGDYWVSSIEASRFDAGRVYVTFDAHRSDNDLPHVFVSKDYGWTWSSLRANLPDSAGSSRVIREDITNQDVLYLGTEFGIWVSIDQGGSWTSLKSNLPTVAVHEIAQHRSSGEIVAGTHGRSLWILDVTPIRQMSAETIADDVYLYTPTNAIRWRSQPRRGASGTRRFVGRNPDQNVPIFYSLASNARNVSLRITDAAGETIRDLEDMGREAGLHRVEWNMRPNPPSGQGAGSGQFGGRRGRGGGRFGGRGGFGGRFGRLVATGKYNLVLSVDGTTITKSFEILRDPDYPQVTNAEEGLLEFFDSFGEEEEREDRESSGDADNNDRRSVRFH